MKVRESCTDIPWRECRTHRFHSCAGTNSIRLRDLATAPLPLTDASGSCDADGSWYLQTFGNIIAIEFDWQGNNFHFSELQVCENDFLA
jgi:hypothetical protein